jgi:heterogeneous nuclear ribonucleoprotein F/H
MSDAAGDTFDEGHPRHVENTKVVRLRGLPFYSTEGEVRLFVEDYPLDDPDAVIVIPFGAGRGDGYVRFISPAVARKAQIELNHKLLGARYIELMMSTEASMAIVREQVAQRQAALSSNRVLRLRGLPFRATPDDIIEFFQEAVIVDISFVETADNRQTGDAYIELLTDESAAACIARNRQLMGTRYIEVIDSSAVEREVALSTHRHRAGRHSHSRSVTDTRDVPHSMMLPSVTVGAAPLPLTPHLGNVMDAALGSPSWGMPMAMPIPPFFNPVMAFAMQQQMFAAQQQQLLLQQQQQQLIQQQQRAAQRKKQRDQRQQQQQEGNLPQNRFVVRVRGLPFSVNENMIADFFHDVSIPREGVHMVLNLQERPTGEAFVEVETEEDVQQALNHNGCALLHRYIEVFRSSIADMARLGGFEPPSPAAPVPVPSLPAPLGVGFEPPLVFSPPPMPMLPLINPQLGMPSMSVGAPPIPLLGSCPIKVEVKPNEEYLRWYTENRRQKQEQVTAEEPQSADEPAPAASNEAVTFPEEPPAPENEPPA